MERSASQTARRIRGRVGKTFLTGLQEAIDAVADALDDEFGHLRHADKLIAREIERSEKTVSNWRDRKNLPDGLSLIRLMQASPAVRAAIDRLVRDERGRDEDFEREFARFQRNIARLIEERRRR